MHHSIAFFLQLFPAVAELRAGGSGGGIGRSHQGHQRCGAEYCVHQVRRVGVPVCCGNQRTALQAGMLLEFSYASQKLTEMVPLKCLCHFFNPNVNSIAAWFPAVTKQVSAIWKVYMNDFSNRLNSLLVGQSKHMSSDILCRCPWWLLPYHSLSLL